MPNVSFQATTATPPSGTVVAADDVSEVIAGVSTVTKFQQVKLDVGVAGISSPVSGGQATDNASVPVALTIDDRGLLRLILLESRQQTALLRRMALGGVVIVDDIPDDIDLVIEPSADVDDPDVDR